MTTDTKIQELLKKVEEKKAAIKSGSERHSWKTNGVFKWSSNEVTNINVADTDALVNMLAYLMRQKSSHDMAVQELGVNSSFRFGGFAYETWLEDIKYRLNNIQVAKNKKDLALLEEKLNQLMSPELKAKMALEEIEELLKN